MRRAVLLGLVLGLAGASAPVAAQTPPRGDRPRGEAMQERQAELEARVHQQFVAQAAQRLGLDAQQRERLHQVLRAGAEARRDLAQESRQLRAELVRAVRSEDASPATFQTLLDRMAALRDREQALARGEDATLAEFLDPRQRAMFLILRMQMSERVRGMRGDRPRPGLGPPGD
jgi:uncharacterized membrane protein